MADLAAIKAQARKAAFARRKEAFDMGKPGAAGHLSEVLAGYRGVPLSGYMPIRTEIDPLPAMAEAAAHGAVGVPVIEGAGLPLRFSRWQPEAPLREGPFGAMVPAVDDFFEPEILIVPLVAFDLSGGRLGYGGGFYDRTLELLRSKRATLAIGFAFDAQEAEDLPLEPTDQPLDMIVTESRILQFSR
ncbi:5-formyltetrahydrofolate cyclo-ligase [Phaeobacter gallaeciensis]|uniref:5-formyltetrahydrofolate cyclo-ligase n=1 Tax=Phaeobacter gallaeciensis TaxID=60890 RepID=UPI0023802FAC|nr:5-formyltetrahydrofolate cyclo-ligase [Phaeobacter gallaeciensis]MDE4274173.1 5-formyltetrahydrofolate cyclo-ligase [Phaeobacter gallaeciensis]MDE4299413.1 5-formyltetrahydrofolate cyclo-ligase [Phaeobacter gallaeciensis]MDE5184577.1 5-formyltetrahydrofolate cyclo-ligase [Phaeobacter gallaeciensis]